MLAEININNFAIIDRLALRLSDGFNVLTGETGAGKSIIIDAVGAMLGGKIGPEYVRAGTNVARVEGLFDVTLPPASAAVGVDLSAPADENDGYSRFVRLRALLDQYGLLDDEEQTEGEQVHTLILTREIHASGRTVARINGRVVNTPVLRQVGEGMIDIHGQNEHVSLLRVNEHIELLDQYAGLVGQRARLASRVTELRSIQKEIAGLQRDDRELARRRDLLAFQVEEITNAALSDGEEEELAKERQLLSAAEKLTGIADHTYRLLYVGYDDSDDEGMSGRAGKGRAAQAAGRSAIDMLTESQGALDEMARYDDSFVAQRESLDDALYKLEDVARAVRAFRDRVEADPARLAEIEDRLDMVRSLKRKYGQSIAEIIAFGKKAATELDAIEHSDERLQELQAKEAKLLNKIGAVAGELAVARRAAAGRLSEEVERSLGDLRLLRARFIVQISHNDAGDKGAPVKAVQLDPTAEGNEVRRLAFDARGVDRVEFYISLNPGEPPKPLAKVASGGETARLMLAIESILAASDSTPTLIFDEVDVGVGARSGGVVGEKLWGLTNHGGHQVICITHLPNIAAFGDAHYKIQKLVRDERTVTTVTPLMPDERLEEVAAMHGTPITDAYRQTAQVMLADTDQIKQAARAKVAEELKQPFDDAQTKLHAPLQAVAF